MTRVLLFYRKFDVSVGGGLRERVSLISPKGRYPWTDGPYDRYGYFFLTPLLSFAGTTYGSSLGPLRTRPPQRGRPSSTPLRVSTIPERSDGPPKNHDLPYGPSFLPSRVYLGSAPNYDWWPHLHPLWWSRSGPLVHA